jgi:hypothetical protein
MRGIGANKAIGARGENAGNLITWPNGVCHPMVDEALPVCVEVYTQMIDAGGQLPPTIEDLVFRLRWEVSNGVSSSSNGLTVDFDPLVGTRLSVHATSLVLEAIYKPGTYEDRVTAAVNVYIGIGIGGEASSAPCSAPQRTVKVGALTANTESANFAIPHFTGSVAPIGDASAFKVRWKTAARAGAPTLGTSRVAGAASGAIGVRPVAGAYGMSLEAAESIGLSSIVCGLVIP